MNRKQRHQRRAIDNGEVYTLPRKPAMPSPKVFKLKTGYKRIKKIRDEDGERI